MSLGDARILIVDDHPLNRKLLEDLLRVLGISIIETAADGIEGLAAVDRLRPDLVLLDVMMPRMDGYEMCRQLRRRYPRSELPVIFVTAIGSPDERAACFAAGGTDLISKPVNAAEVAARVGVHLENRKLLAGLKAFQERVGEELAAARGVQLGLQPSAEILQGLRGATGFDVAGLIETSCELGGDFWTAFEAGPQQLGLLVVDFSGHGVAAALNVFRLHALLTRLPKRPWQPAPLLDFLNGQLKQLLKPGQFAAALAAVADRRAGTLAYAGGLTPAPVLVTEGQARLLPTAGPPLGAFEDADFAEQVVAMPPGAALLAYSDALVESQMDGTAVVDEATLLAWAADAAKADDIPRAILSRFHQRLPGEPPDDLTLVCLRHAAE